MSELQIEVAENGFIVSEGRQDLTIGRKWGFESPESLAKFIKEWGEENHSSDK